MTVKFFVFAIVLPITIIGVVIIIEWFRRNP